MEVSILNANTSSNMSLLFMFFRPLGGHKDYIMECLKENTKIC